MRITINGSEVVVLNGSLDIDDAIGERSTVRFVVKTDSSTHFQQGQPVEIYDDSNDLIYAGVIDKPAEKAVSDNTILLHSISCKDMHYLADKRIFAKAYEQTLAGDIAKDIITTKLADEGVWGNTRALSFDGVDDYVECSNAPIFNLTSGTIEAKVKSNRQYPGDTSSNSFRVIASKTTGGSTADISYALDWFGTNSLGNLRFIVSNGITNKSIISPYVFDDEWHRVESI